MQDKVPAFLRYLEVVKRCSKETIRAYAADLQGFFSLVKNGGFTKETVRFFLQDLYEKKAKRSSVLRKVSCLRCFARFLCEKKYLQENPLATIATLKREKLLPKAVSYEEVVTLFSQPDTSNYLGFRDRAIMELFYSCGLRISELVCLSRSDWKKSRMLLQIQGKGRKQRMVPITHCAANWLREYLEHPQRFMDTKLHKKQQDSAAIFLNRWGKRLSARSINRSFFSYLQKSGLSASITPHTLRHTIATHWLENEMDLESIQKLLGHNSLEATTIYTKVSKKLQKKVYDQAHPECKKM